MEKDNEKYIYIGQDNTKIDSNLKKTFRLEQGLDTRFLNKREECELFDLVGLIVKQNEVLVVFPKHYFSSLDIYKANTNIINVDSDIKLLFDTIYKYISTQDRKGKASRYSGKDIDYVSDYPFASFFSIYRYFQQFGIYKERVRVIKKNKYGKVSWKDTIKKSQRIVSGNSFIHLPLLSIQNKSIQVLLGDCMTFAINYTLNKFPFLISLPKVSYPEHSFDFLNNTHFIIKHLELKKSECFKDIHINLIDDLITFFIELDKCQGKGGDIHVKIKYFNLVWEDMVEKYLNNHFLGVNQDQNELLFNKSKQNNLSRFSKMMFRVDQSSNRYTIAPDHYLCDNEFQYIFDAKYYANIEKLNYKQFSYHEILKTKSSNTISALLLPCDDEINSSIHFSLADDFVVEGNNKTVIILQYLNIKEVMCSYVRT